MKFVPVRWLLCVVTVSAAATKMQQSTTPRSRPQFGDTIKQVTNQLMEPNSTSGVALDTRTPPRVKQLMKMAERKAENSHPGVAEPLDDDAAEIEESVKKLTFYKSEKSTTDSGISTWILLSGQSTATPSTGKPSKANATIVNPNRLGKPIFKKKPPAVKVATVTSTTTTTTTTAASTTTPPTKLTKIKATNSSVVNKTSTNPIKVKVTTPIATITSEANPELKEGGLELSTTTTTANPKKSRRPTNKKKKNKTKVANKIPDKQKPISTQIYNYLAREVMPTVGVGLVGLMVTAGLASYFLYPFGGLRRSYDVDRKDKEGSYYYGNDYSNGMAEEDAIGKVIAGMPAANLNSFRYQNSRNGPSTRYRYTTSPQGSVETVQLNRLADYNTEKYPDPYYSNEINKNDPISYTTGQFVVGNSPQEAATPAPVPEHGPRSLKIRRRRVANDDYMSNEIIEAETSAYGDVTTIPTPTTTGNGVDEISDRLLSFVNMFRDLLYLKFRMGLEMLQNKTRMLSGYISQVQERLDASEVKH